MSSYDRRELEIIQKLKDGRTREDIAKDYDYASWKSLDIFMRRRMYIWNSDENIYEPEKTNTDNIRYQLISNISIKAEQVINRIADGEDPRQIAKSLGFEEGNRQMSDYMEKEGLIWDSEEENYVEGNIKSTNSNASLSSKESELEDSVRSKKDEIRKNIDLEVDSEELSRYLPMFEMLYENRDRLSELLLEDNVGNIPKYIVPGASKTKSIYMNDKLSRLMADFASTSGISQREIVETSIILYMKRFGGSYKKDIDLLLSQI